jgi:hypothetical protein
MVTTAECALAPYRAEPGPRITSMRSMSSMWIGSACHTETPNISMLFSRPSISTSTLSPNSLVAARAPTEVHNGVTRKTSTSGTWRSRQTMSVQWVFSIISRSMTVTAEGDSAMSCRCRAAVYTTFSSSSRSNSSKSSISSALAGRPRRTNAMDTTDRNLKGAFSRSR